MSFAMNDRDADVYAERVKYSTWETEILIRTPLGKLQACTTRLPVCCPWLGIFRRRVALMSCRVSFLPFQTAVVDDQYASLVSEARGPTRTNACCVGFASKQACLWRTADHHAAHRQVQRVQRPSGGCGRHRPRHQPPRAALAPLNPPMPGASISWSSTIFAAVSHVARVCTVLDFLTQISQPLGKLCDVCRLNFPSLAHCAAVHRRSWPASRRWTWCLGAARSSTRGRRSLSLSIQR